MIVFDDKNELLVHQMHVHGRQEMNLKLDFRGSSDEEGSYSDDDDNNYQADYNLPKDQSQL